MLHDRNPMLTMISDKLLVRNYVTQKVGNDFLIPLLWHGTHPEEIPYTALPQKFVLKTNHGSGNVILVSNTKKINTSEINRRLKKWMGMNFTLDLYLGIGWGYKNIRPSIMVESFIEEKGKAPVDYKFYCFSGHVEFLTVHYDRFEQHRTRAFDRNFVPYNFRYDLSEWSGECQRPQNFEAMVEIAERLAEDFDFIRADLYSVGDHIYFGELTPYPGGVTTKFLPLNRDNILGDKWKDFSITAS